MIMKKFFLCLISNLSLILLIVSNLSAAKHIIEVKDFEFSPAELNNVAIGDTIRWEWVSGFHTTTSGSIPEGAVPWDEPITQTITSFEYVVEIPGTYHYVCTPHVPHMVGSFIVLPDANLVVEPDNQDVTYTAGSTTFSVFSNTSWTVESDATWCTPTAGGHGDGIIEADFEENPLSEVRVAALTVSSIDHDTVVVTITQSASGVFVSEVGLAGVQIYPNPSNGIVTLELERFAGKQVGLKLLSLDGRIVRETSITAESNYAFLTTDIPAGVYILTIQSGNETFAIKLSI